MKTENNRTKTINVFAFFLSMVVVVFLACPPEIIRRSTLSSYSSEGSSSAPVQIVASMGGTEHISEVNKGRSYYYTQGLASNHSVRVILDGMDDDLDLISFGTDNTFDTESFKCFYGRTLDEYCSSSGTAFLYFVVDGSYTDNGSAYTLTVSSRGPAVVNNNYDRGSVENPVLIPTGLYTDSHVSTGTSYYKAAVSAGNVYRVNLFDASNLNVYTDSDFTVEATGNIIPTDDFIYISVNNNGTYAHFYFEVVMREGRLSTPTQLFVEKTNFCQVDTSSSFYIFDVSYGESYTASVTSMSNGVDVYVHNSSNFTNFAEKGVNGGTADENVTFIATRSQITVRIDDVSGDGATYKLAVTKN